MRPGIPTSVLLTGATGFIGGRLAARLKREGCDLHLIVRPSSDLTAVQGLGEIHAHDGTTESMLRIMDRARPQVVFHLASLFLTQHTASDVSRLVRSNVEFTALLGEAAAASNVACFINTGTAWQHYHNEPYNPVNLYAATKQAGADILRFHAENRSLRVITLELFDTYGPDDRRPKLFTALRNAARTSAPLAMSPGDQLIDLVYIDDVVNAFLTAAARPGAGEAPFETFSISSGNPRTLRDVVRLWSSITGRALNLQWGARPHRPREMLTSWSGGAPLPGWRSSIPLEDGISLMEERGEAP